MKKFLKLCCAFALVLVSFLVLIGCGEELTSIAIKNNKDLYVGDTASLAVETTPAKMDVTVEWSSSDANIASVNANGVVTAVKVGTVTITATVKGNEAIKDTASVTVKEKTLESIAIKNAKDLAVNEEATLSVTTTPSGLEADVTWTSSDEAVATVSASGVVKGLKVGSTTITATVKDNTAIKNTVTINVKSEGGSDKVKSGSDVAVEDADITNLLGTGKLYVTTFGQADRDYVQELVDEAIAGTTITYTYNHQLLASDVEAGSLVIAVVGFTSKGISGNITQTGEVQRAKDFSEKTGVNLVIVQLDGKARRGSSSDPIITEAVKNAKVVMIYDNGSATGADYDGQYTTWCEGKQLYKFSDEFDMYEYIAVLVGAKK